MSDHLDPHQPPLPADIGCEADMRPAVRGGQGRTDQSVIDDGSAMAGILLALFIGSACWCAAYLITGGAL